MKKIAYLGIVLLSMGLFVLSCGKDDGPEGPDQQNTVEIDGVDPLSGPVGTTVVLEGKNFGDTKADNTVKFNGVTASIVTASTTRLTVKVPDGATDGPVTVKVGSNTATSSSDFVVTPLAIELNNTTLELKTFDTHVLEVVNLNDFVDKDVQWEVDNGDVLEVDGDGNVFALQAGTATITATIGSISGTCSVTIEPSVFVVGEEHDGDNNVAMLWKNGVGTILQTTGFDSYANGVFVHGKDVYVAGHERHTENISEYVGKVWKNGTLLYTLTTQSQDARLNSIFVTDSGDVYAVGDVHEEGVSHATIWKNGVELYVLNSNTSANSIFVVDGEDILVAGSKEVDGKYIARVWVNDDILYSMTNENDMFADDVFMSGSNVFIVGSEDLQDGQIAKIWKNGSPFYSSSGDGYASYSSVFVVGDKVYACGHEFNGNNYEAQIYDNGTVSNFTDGITSALTFSLFVHDGSSYIAGYQNNSEMNRIAKVWKDKEELYSLGSDGTNSSAKSIFVN